MRRLILTFASFVTFCGSVFAQITITNSPPDGRVNVPYNFQFTANGGNPGNYHWSYNPDTGGPPPGVNLSPSGQLSGTPSKPGSFPIDIFVTDGPNGGNGSFNITISACTLAFITGSQLSAGDVNTPYSQAIGISATGCTPPYTYAASSIGPFNSGSLPPGLSIGNPPAGSTSGLIAGTPTTAGANPYFFNITVTDSSKVSATSEFSIAINPQLAIGAVSPLPAATVGQPYSQSLMPTGGTTPYYSFTWDTPAPDMTLDSPSGLIHGTAKTKDIGVYTFTATLKDNILAQTQKTFQLPIVAAQPLLQVSPLSLNFSGITGGDAPPPQALSIALATTASSTFTVVIDGGQPNTQPPFAITVKPASGTAPAQLLVSVDQSGVQAASTSGRIRILDQSNNETDIAVNLNLTVASPQLQVVPSVLRFGARVQTPGILEQDLAITNTGGAPAGFSVTDLNGSSWISGFTPGSGQTERNSAAFVRVRINTQGLKVGSYNDTIHVAYAGGSVDVPLSLFVAESGPILGVDVTGLLYQADQGGGFSNTQVLKVLDLGGPASTVNWSAKIVSGSDTVSLGASSGTATPSTPGFLAVNLAQNATQLAPGAHYALISISDPNAHNSPLYVVVVLDLAAANSPPVPDLNPAGLFFVVAAGGAASAPQNVAVNTSDAQAVTFQAAASTADGGKWLAVNPASGQTSGATAGTFAVSVNPASMTAGIYSGQASASISGAVRTVNVTAVVLPAGSTVGTSEASAPASARQAPRAVTCTPSKLALTETGLVNNFSIPASWPATLIVQLNDDCANAVTSGAVVASFSNGDSPVSLLNGGQDASYSATWQPGTTSAQMVVTLNANAGTLAPATMQLAGGVSQNQAAAPTLVTGGTLNNVNPVVGDPLAPGTIAQVYGGNLASTSVSPGVLPIPTSFNGTFALVGPNQVPLYYLSSGQLDVEIPSELAANQQYPIIVSVNGALTVPDTITVIPDAPGIVTYLDGPAPNVQDGAHIIAQHNADYSLVNAANPAKPGEYVTMYLVGMGATNPPVASGIAAPSSPLAQLVDQPTLTVDGNVVPASDIAFAGLTPGSVSLYQITFKVPSGLSSSDVDLVVTQSGRSSNTTKLPAAP